MLSFEWREGLRGLLLIEGYAWPLRIFALMGLDFNIVVRYNIYVLHLFYLIVGDYFFFKFGEAYFNKRYTDVAFLLRLTSALYSDFMSRPFGNTVEEILFVIGAFYFKKIYDNVTKKGADEVVIADLWKFALVVPVSFLIRNTAAILWIPPLLWILFTRPKFVPYFFATTVPFFLFSLANDYRFYGKLIIPFIQFATFNHGQFWHESPTFFVTIAIPAFMTLMTPAAFYGGYTYVKELRSKKEWCWLAIIPSLYIFFYTINPHKEIRFILPIVPIFLYFSAQTVQDFLD